MDILIIDDHPVYSEGLSLVLKRSIQSCRVTSVSSISYGINVLKNSETGFNLLLIGVNNEAIDRINELEELIRTNNNLPVIVLSAVFDCLQFIKYLDIGVRGVIPKLYSVEKMIAAITECYGGGLHIPPDVRAAIKLHTSKHLTRHKVTTALHLTKRQLQVLELIERRMTNNEIAEMLSVSLATVKTHINKLYSALGVCGRKECIKRSYDLGVLYHEGKAAI